MAMCNFFPSGRGVPNLLAQLENNHARRMHPSLVPTLEDAVVSYESSGGNLSAATLFGTDPLSGHQEFLLQRELFMQTNNPNPEDIFSHVVNGSSASFAQSLQSMIDHTNYLSRQL